MTKQPEMKCIRITAETQKRLAKRAIALNMPMWKLADIIIDHQLAEFDANDQEEGIQP